MEEPDGGASGPARGVESRGDGWSTTDQSGQMGHSGLEGARSHSVPVWLSGRALRQQRKRLWVRFPGNIHTNENV